MTDLIQRIVDAIIRQEGMPAEYANPGNLRGAPWLMNPVMMDNFWQPINRQQGIAGAAHLVALHVAEGNSLEQLITIWAPPSDGNDTATYIRNVQAWAEIQDAATPLWNYIGS